MERNPSSFDAPNDGFRQFAARIALYPSYTGYRKTRRTNYPNRRTKHRPRNQPCQPKPKPQTLLTLLLLSLTSTAPALDYRYDDLGRLTQAIHPSGQTLEYRYDAAGNLLEITETVTALYHLQGRVLDATGNPLPGVDVRAGDYTALTDAAGEWQIPHLPGGGYTLRASHPEHAFTPQNLILSADAAVDISADN